MSKTVDNRVVEMQFDNKDFEKNVQTSIGTLDKLNASLKNMESGAALEGLSHASRNFSLDGIGLAVDGLTDKFSAFGDFARRIIENIADEAFNLGKKVVNDLVIQPRAEGFNEFELKMGSVQTILAGVEKDYGSHEEALSAVNTQLEELNKYSDQTIYSFKDMTSNIGKFTNAGVKLEDSVAAIKGVANLAALSGANAEQASHAMYNFAQALSSGYVKLIDWKSIENANMATVEFKEELIKTALECGTLQKSADGMYESLTQDNQGHTATFNALHDFNDGLKAQWMTTEVLTKTLNKYADDSGPMGSVGKRATEAATKVKTFTMMMDALKEAAGSGWAMTFEHIFGNFDEGVDLWTRLNDIISDVIESSAKARNDLLKDWKALGGRTDLWDGVFNIINAVKNVVDAVSKAFREVFPPTTGEKLASITKGFKEFSEGALKFSTIIAPKLERIFKGIFSILSIGVKVISGIVGAIAEVFGVIPKGNFGTGFLDFFANLGDSIYSFNQNFSAETFKNLLLDFFDFLKTIPIRINIFIKSLSGIDIGEKLSFIADALKNGFKGIKDAFKGFNNKIDTSGFDDFVATIKEKFHPIQAVIGFFMFIWEKIKAVAAVVIPVLKEVGTKIGNALGGFFSKIWAALQNGDFKAILDLINTGLIGTILNNIRKITSIGDIIDKITGKDGLLDKATEVLDGVRECLETYQNRIKAEILKKIAFAIAILVGAIAVLSFLDHDKLLASVGAITAMFVELLGAMKIMDKIIKDSNKVQTLGWVMAAMAGSILILAFALQKLNELSYDEIVKGLIGIVVVLGVLMGGMKILSQVFKENKTDLGELALDMVVIAFALKLLTGAVALLAGTENLKKGLAGLGVMMLEMAGFLAAMAAINKYLGGVPKGLMQSALSLGVLAVALMLMAGAIKILSLLEPETMADGLFRIIKVLAVFVIYSKLIKPQGLISAAISMGILAVSLTLMAGVLKLYSLIKPETMGKGLLFVAGALAGIGLAMRVFPKAPDMLASAIALGVIAGVLIIISAIMQTMAKLSWGELIRGLIGVGGSVAILALAVKGMAGSMSGALALIIVAGALVVLTYAIKMMMGLRFDQIVDGLKGLGIALVGMFVAALAFGAAHQFMLAGAIAIAALGGAMMVAAGGIFLFAKAVPALNDALPTMIAMAQNAELLYIFGGVIAFLGVAAIPASVGLTLLGASFIAMGAGLVVLSGGLALIGVTLPLFLEALPAMIEIAKNFDSVIKFAGAIAILGLGCLIGAKGVALMGLALVSLGAGLAACGGGLLVLSNAINQLSGSIPAVLTLLSFTNEFMALAAGIISFGTLGYLAGPGLMVLGAGLLSVSAGMAALSGAIIILSEAFKALQIFKPIVEGILQFFSALIRGIGEFISSAWNAIMNFCKAIIDGVKSVFDMHSPSKVFERFGANIIQGLINGIVDNIRYAVTAIGELGSQIIDKAKEVVGGFVDVGKNVVSGFSEGVKNTASGAFDKVKEFGNGILSKAKKTLRIESPSKETEEMGMYFDQGLGIGITDNMDLPINATSLMGGDVLQSLSDSMPMDVVNGLGKDINFNLSDGISQFASIPTDQAGILGDDTLASLSSSFGDGTDLGKLLNENLGSGISQYSDISTNQASLLGDNTKDSLSKALSDVNLDDMIDGDMNLSPEITPVLDLSNIEAGSNDIDKMFGGKSINLSGSVGASNSDLSSIAKSMSEKSDASSAAVVERLNTMMNGLMAIQKSLMSSDMTAKTTEVGVRALVQTTSKLHNDMVTNNMNLTKIGTGITQGNSVRNASTSKMLSGLERVNNNIVNANSKLSQLGNYKVVLDTGTLVGELVGPMDSALGRRSARSSRERW